MNVPDHAVGDGGSAAAQTPGWNANPHREGSACPRGGSVSTSAEGRHSSHRRDGSKEVSYPNPDYQAIYAVVEREVKVVEIFIRDGPIDKERDRRARTTRPSLPFPATGPYGASGDPPSGLRSLLRFILSPALRQACSMIDCHCSTSATARIS